MRIRAILLAKNGTLVDVGRTVLPALDAVIAGLAEGDAELGAEIASVLGYDRARGTLQPGSPVGPASPAELAHRIAPAFGEKTASPALIGRLNALLAAETARHFTPVEGAAQAVAQLKTLGYRIGISTNASAEHARQDVERLGLLGRIDFLAGFNSGFGAKPQPGHVHAFARFIDLPTAAIACIGASGYDVTAARAAGATSILLAPADGALHGAEHRIGDLAEVGTLLEALASTPA